MKWNKILLLAAAILLVLSAFTYRESVTRAERFERGQKFLANLNPDEIAKIHIAKGGETTLLERSGERFLVRSAEGYPAKNEAINGFIRNVLDLSLEKEVGVDEGLHDELGLVKVADAGEETTEVAFEDSAGKEMVRFLVGKAGDSGDGNYVRRTDTETSEIFLTSGRAYFSTGADDFLDKEIVNHTEAELKAVRGADFSIERPEEGGPLALAALPAGRKESAQVGQLKALLSGLRFTQHFLANDPAVSGLRFGSPLAIELTDQSAYELAVAEQDGKHYLRIFADHLVTELAIDPNDDEEVVKEKSEILARNDEIREFNAFHGSWVYEITETTADKVRLAKKDLSEKT